MNTGTMNPGSNHDDCQLTMWASLVSRVKYLVTAAVVACALAGCTSAEAPSPNPSAPSSVLASSPNSTPTPTWSADDQAAINAVQRYIQMWTQVTQGLPDSDTTAIRTVAWDPLANATVTLWAQWIGRGWHLVGAPSFEPSMVTPGELDKQGQRYHVYGCYVMGDSHLSDVDGNPAGTKSGDRSPTIYDVIVTPDGQYYVINENEGEGTC